MALQKYGAVIDRLARRLVARTGLQSAYDDLWSAGRAGPHRGHAPLRQPQGGVASRPSPSTACAAPCWTSCAARTTCPAACATRTDEMQKAKHKLSAQLGREATVEEVAEEMDADLDEVSGVHALLEPHVPLDRVMASLVAEDERARIR